MMGVRATHSPLMRINNDVLERLDAVEVPAPQILVGRLSQLLNQEAVSAGALAAAIELDATLAVRLLRLANSVVLGGSGGVETVEEAVVRVGTESIRDVVYALSLVGTLKPAGFGYRPFWRHSLAVAQASRLLEARRVGAQADPMPEAYTAGLLHDIGMLVFDRAIGSRYKTVLVQARTERLALWEVERSLFAIDHAQAGARMLEAWGLPPRLVGAARFHHEVDEQADAAARVVHLADMVCNHIGIHHGTGFMPKNMADPSWEILGIDVGVLPDVSVEVRRGIERADRFLAAV